MKAAPVKYPNVQPIDSEWFSELPAHWNLHPLKTVVQFKGGGTPTKSELRFWGGDIPWVSPKDMKRFVIDYSEDHITAEAVADSSTKFVPIDAVLLVVRSGILRHTIPVALAGRQLTLNQDMKALIPGPRIVSEYLAYLISGNQRYLLSAWRKEGATVESLEQEYIGNTDIPVPPVAEQRTIAAFLDHETARIDRLIEKQERLIELLKEKRQAVISHAVTEGTGRSVKLSYCADLLPGYAFPSSDFSRNPSDVKLLRGVNVGLGVTKWEDVMYWPSDRISEVIGFLLREGDIVIGMDRPWISGGARVATISKDDLPALLLQRVCLVRARKGMAHQPFLEFALMSNEFRAFVEADLTGVSVPHLSAEQIGSFRLALPVLQEQERIVDEAKQQMSAIEKTTDSAMKLIALAEERRAALISAAVTGKIDVRNWKPAEASPEETAAA